MEFLQLKEKLTSLMNEEKWTRAALGNYTVANFIELDKIYVTIDKEHLAEAKELIDDHLAHNKNSIIALYLSGILTIAKNKVDDNHLTQLTSLFFDNHKMTIVEYLCNRILDFCENRFALRKLAQCHQENGNDEKKIEIWQRLVNVDYEETEICQELANHFYLLEQKDEAVNYYKKAMYRFIGKKQFNQTKEIWAKLLELDSEDFTFFLYVNKKINDIFSADKAAGLLTSLFDVCKTAGKLDNSIDVLKQILAYQPESAWARETLVETYRQKYKNHSHLQESITAASLEGSARNIFEAIANFEKYIAFDKGNYVFHGSWGLGKIKEIDNDNLVIDFIKKKNHRMTLKMAINSLATLSRNHITVLKARKTRDALRKKIMSDIPWTLKTIIQSHENSASFKIIKSELVPSVLTEKEWLNWSGSARKVMQNDTSFSSIGDRANHFMVRAQPISFEEKIFNQFKGEKSFLSRYKVCLQFIDKVGVESDYFKEIFSFFTSYLRSFSGVTEEVTASFMLIRKVSRIYPHLDPKLDIEFSYLFQATEGFEKILQNISNQELIQQILIAVKEEIADWPRYYCRYFYILQSQFIINQLEAHNESDVLREIIETCFSHYRDYRESFIWLVCNYLSEDKIAGYNLSDDRILIGMIHLLEILYRQLENKRDATGNRRLLKQINNYLFKEMRLTNFVAIAPEASLNRLYSLVNDVKNLDPKEKVKLYEQIKKRFPEFKFQEKTEETETVVGRGLLTIHASYLVKQKELQHILEVEIPANSKEIGEAIKLGDLSENAEYKAGKERQEQLNIMVGKLRDDLEKAHVINAVEVNTEKIGFGCEVVLENDDNGKEETYIILGPWESDPTKKKISYLSPFAIELMNHKVDDRVSFTINERDYSYKIKEITACDF